MRESRRPCSRRGPRRGTCERTAATLALGPCSRPLPAASPARHHRVMPTRLTRTRLGASGLRRRQRRQRLGVSGLSRAGLRQKLGVSGLRRRQRLQRLGVSGLSRAGLRQRLLRSRVALLSRSGLRNSETCQCRAQNSTSAQSALENLSNLLSHRRSGGLRRRQRRQRPQTQQRLQQRRPTVHAVVASGPARGARVWPRLRPALGCCRRRAHLASSSRSVLRIHFRPKPCHRRGPWPRAHPGPACCHQHRRVRLVSSSRSVLRIHFACCHQHRRVRLASRSLRIHGRTVGCMHLLLAVSRRRTAVPVTDLHRHHRLVLLALREVGSSWCRGPSQLCSDSLRPAAQHLLMIMAKKHCEKHDDYGVTEF